MKHPRPILISDTSPAVLLENVPLSGASGTSAYNEGWLQNLLYRHPQSLPIMETNPSFAGLIPICRELSTPAGPLDVLYATPEGRLVVLEAKLWRNPEARRKVVAQLFDYAKELSHWTYETLDAKVREALRMDGAELSLFKVMREKHADLDEALFYDSVSRSLRRGDMLLLIAGDGIHENVWAITNFIENHGTFHFAFGLIEMAIYRMPHGSHLVQPRVVAHSEVIRRIVVDIRDGQLVEPEEGDDEATDAAPRPGLEEQRDKFKTFWQEFLEKYPLDDKSQPIKKPTTWTNQFFDMPEGSGGRIAAVAADRSGNAGVYLSFPMQPVSDQIYDALLADKAAIDKEIGQSLRWERNAKDEWQSVSIWCEFGDRLLPEHRVEAQKWLGNLLNRFVNAFRPRIDAVLRELKQS